MEATIQQQFKVEAPGTNMMIHLSSVYLRQKLKVKLPTFFSIGDGTLVTSAVNYHKLFRNSIRLFSKGCLSNSSYKRTRHQNKVILSITAEIISVNY